MYITYAYLEIFAVIVILVLFVTGLSRKKEINKSLMCLVITFIFLLIADSTTWLLLEKLEYLNILKVYWIIFYILLNGCIVSFHEYVLSHVGSKVKWKRIVYFLVEVMALTGIILWIISMFNGFIYYFDEKGMYQYRPAYAIIVILFGLPVLCDLAIIIRNCKVLGKRKTIALLSYGFLPLATLPVTLVIGSSIITVLATSISIILIYVVASMETQADLYIKEAEIAEKNMDLADKQFKLIYSQIQPHFLYNVLNTIYYLVDDDIEKGKKAIVDFSDYMRMNLDSLTKPMLIDFDDELKKTEIYLSLEKLRFEDELNISFDIQERNFKIPQLTIQPLIENAVKHGICKKKGGGTVSIYSKQDGDFIEIGVVDDGVGFDKLKPLSEDRSHIGLSNIVYRVEHMCGGTVTVDSTVGVGTSIIIRIPKEAK